MEGKREESKKAYEHCIAIEDNPYARIKLGLTLLEEEQPAKASVEFEKAFSVNTHFEEKLPPEAASAARYLFGVAYAKMGKLPAAKEQLNVALAIKPDNADAQDLLRQIDNVKH
jgi:tetratricopeptide (TPR) repeat protein